MTEIPYDDWEPVIGLEIHTQLNTRTKMFSRAPNHFGDEPNANIGLIDTAQPGTLPVINKSAVDKAIRFGCAIDAEVSHFTAFDRKSYFYPDSPRNFQITQFYHPIVQGGKIVADVDGKTKEFYIKEAHLEDDSGMLKHFSSFAGVDYNRAGVPLLEIVSEPCMHSPKDAAAYAMAVRSLLIYLDVSNCNMEEGSLRMDTNISVRKKGEKSFRNKVEIKNLNSFSNMQIAIESEIRRQIKLYHANPYKDPKEIIEQTTVRFDLEKKETVAMRSKEFASDYRYFPEPDLPPLFITQEQVDSIKSNLPELPHERFDRYVQKYGLSEYNASLLVNDKPLSDFFEESLKHCENPIALCNWVTVEFTGRIKDFGKTLPKFGISAENIGKLVRLIDKKTITGRIGKSIADIMVEHPEKPPSQIIEENPDFKPLNDPEEIGRIIDQILEKNPSSITDYQNGIKKAFHFIFGQIMKETKGKADPEVVKELLIQKLKD